MKEEIGRPHSQDASGNPQPALLQRRFLVRWTATSLWLVVVGYYGLVAWRLVESAQHNGWSALLRLSDVLSAFIAASSDIGRMRPPLVYVSTGGIVIAVVLGALWAYATERRATVMRQESERGKQEIVKSLTETLNEADEARVRVAAARSLEELGELGEGAPIERLLIDLREASVPSVRSAAAVTLGKLGPHAPVEPLVTALSDPDAKVRQAAAKALTGLGDRVPVEPLVTVARQDRDAEVQVAAAAAALILLGEQAPVNVLVETLQQNPDTHTRAAAAVALGNVSEKNQSAITAPELTESTSESDATIVQELREVGQRAEVNRIVDVIASL